MANRNRRLPGALQSFVDEILQRRIFDVEKLADFLEPLRLNWKSRRKDELSLMEELTPLLHKIAQDR